MVTKEQMTGIKVKLGNKEDWDYLSNICKSLGLEQATWKGCDFNVNSTAFVSGWEGRFLATHYWEDGDGTAEEFRNLEALSIEDIKLMEKSVITNKEQLENTFIRNEGKLVSKWLGILEKTYSSHDKAFYLVYEKGCVGFMAENTIQGGCGAKWLLNKGYREITLEDFQGEDAGDEKDTSSIDWSRAPEGYDYWVEYVGNMSERPIPDFHKLTTRGYVEVYEDTNGEYHLKSDKDIVVHERTSTGEGNKKVVQKYVREDFKTRGEALNYFDTEGNTLYVPNITGYTVANEMDILDSFGQLFTLEEREETWQDVAQDFIKNNPVLSKDKFVEDMFGDEFPEYHEPMKQLAKIIVEYNKEG